MSVKKLVGYSALAVIRVGMFVCAAQLYCMWSSYVSSPTAPTVIQLDNRTGV